MQAKDQILARLYVVLTLMSLAPLLIAGQVLRIYLAKGDELRAQGERQASSFVTIPAMRGAVLDRAGRVLAVNAARYDLALDPTVDGFTPAVEGMFFERLSKLTGRPAAHFRRKVRERSSPQYVLLVRDLSEAQQEQVTSWDVPGLLLHPRFARRYNYGKTAAHVLGHVDADLRGIAGIELQADEHLQGEPGRRAVKRDRRGIIKAYVGGQVVEPRHGETLVLTIDLIRQTILEEELARGVAESGAQWGTAVAMDPHTGAILAMASAPTYDPNRPGAFGPAARRNRAITDRIEPGSTFKLVAAVAAVEEGVIGLEDTVDTGRGWAVFHGRTMRDTHAHGKIPFAEVIALSSNVGTAKTVSRLDAGTFYQYARNFGFGQPTWVDLPGEVGGVLKRPEEWSGTTQTSMSIGYEVGVTPLQLLTAYSAFANGGLLVQPYVVAERRDVTGRTVWQARLDSVRRVFSPATAQELLPAFERVVEEGTAKQARIEGLPVAGKTGTALKAAGGGYRHGAYRASFAGFFPADDPEVAMVVVLDEPRSSHYGGAVAAPIFQRIARRWIGTFPKLAQRMAPAEDFPERPAAAVPDVEGQPFVVAVHTLEAAGYPTVRMGELRTGELHRLDRVAVQQPPPGTPVRQGTPVQLSLEEVETETAQTMPDLTGLSLRQAAYWLSAHGVAMNVRGSGRVAEQWPEAGAPLPERALLRCK